MRDFLGRWVERRLRRVVPPQRQGAVIGDLVEDYARRRAHAGVFSAWWWLLRETRSLVRAYKSGNSPSSQRSKSLGVTDDLRHAVRRLIRRPVATTNAAALLALGIGCTTAMFSVVDSLLLRPAPFHDADRFVSQGLGPSAAPYLRQVIEAWRANGLIADVGMTAETRSLQPSAVSTSTAWTAVSTTPRLLDELGVKPIRGRLFSGARIEAETIVLSEIIWRGMFGADEGILGRRVTVDGTSRVVIGILPAATRFPTPTTMAWSPFDPGAPARPGIFSVVAKLRPGITHAEAEAQLRDIAFHIVPMPNRRSGPPVVALVATVLNDFTRQALWLLLAGTLLVFLVLCANVCSLLLTQLVARRREIGVGAALGASRPRLMRQALLEQALVAAVGAIGGLGVAKLLTAVVPPVFLDRTLNPIDLDWRALAAAGGFAVLSVLLVGVVPAWLGTRTDPMGALRGSRPTDAQTPVVRVATRGLLVVEIAFACALLVGSALLMRSFANLVHTDRGVHLDGVVHVNLGGLDNAFGYGPAMALGTAAIASHVRAWPEVELVALSREIPPTAATGVVALGPPSGEGTSTAGIETDRYRVDRAFFRIYGIPITRGQVFDDAAPPDHVIVGERLANSLWPDADAVGRTFMFGRTPLRIVAVAGEIRLPTLERERDRPEIYVPLGDEARTLYLNLRCRTVCPDERAMRTRLQTIHSAITARVVPPAAAEYARHLELPRAIAGVAAVFAVIALLTAAAGLFSVLTEAVGRRRREFGIRIALGASPVQMRRLVFRDGAMLVVAGVAAGAAASWFAARALRSFHYGVMFTDPLSWAAVLGAITLTSLAAFLRPSRQAMRLDPVKLLREE